MAKGATDDVERHNSGQGCQSSGSLLLVTHPWPAISIYSSKMLMAAKAFDSSGAAVMNTLSDCEQGERGQGQQHGAFHDVHTFEHGFQGHKVDATDPDITTCTTKQQASPAAVNPAQQLAGTTGSRQCSTLSHCKTVSRRCRCSAGTASDLCDHVHVRPASQAQARQAALRAPPATSRRGGRCERSLQAAAAGLLMLPVREPAVRNISRPASETLKPAPTTSTICKVAAQMHTASIQSGHHVLTALPNCLQLNFCQSANLPCHVCFGSCQRHTASPTDNCQAEILAHQLQLPACFN